ncbi:uncharacterized protein LOC135197062 [Macrobrachium nipponense]|uniref:uncharacterized protein LOC135197062 n=1 Tax=Macrobrachium nipponense TaxID=159736 RepID=UPI0030C8A85D
MSLPSSSQSSEDDFFNGEWIRKATVWEECFELCNNLGCYLIWYQLDLRSKAPLEEAHVRRALSLLYRKCPALSLCFGNHSGERWVRRATNPEIDFKVLQNQKLEDVRKFLHSYRHNTETGPLFCARLLLNPTDLRSEEEDQDPEMTHNSYMLFGLAHCFADGTSNTQIMGFFISLLNDVIANKPISNAPLGVFVSDDQTLKAVSEKQQLLETNPSLRRKMAEAVEKYNTVQPLLITAFPAPAEERKSASLVKILNRELTIRFSRKCKEENVSFNSGFSAVANVALVDLLLESGTVRDSYEIQCFQLVNFRRYWEVQMPKALGLHIGYALPIYKETPKDVGGPPLFWEYARSLHQEILHELDSGKLLLWQAHAKPSSQNLPYTTEYLLGDKSYVGDFVTSNMGDVTSKVTEGGDHVQISNVLRSSAVHLSEFPLEIECHTFRGRFSMIFSYNTAAVSAQITENLCNRIVCRLEELLE